MYRQSAAWFIAGYATQLLSGFLLIWLINRIAGKAEYGLYAFVMAVTSLGITLIANMPERIMLYKLPEAKDADAQEAIKNSLYTWGLVASLIAGGALSLVLYYSHGSSLFAYGFLLLLLLIPIESQKNTAITWIRHNENPQKAIVYGNIVAPLLKVAAIALAFLVPQYLGALVVAFALLFTLWILVEQNFSLTFRNSQITRADLTYGLKMLFTKFTSIGGDKFIVFAIVYFLTESHVAEYVLAFKMAALVMIAHQFFTFVMTPRIKKLAVGDRYAQLLGEYQRNRSYSLVAGAGMYIVLVLVGEMVLGLFGDYGEAYRWLVIIGGFMILNVSFGSNGPFLMMLGNATQVSWIAAITLVLTVLLAFTVIDDFGLLGASIAFGVPVLVGNILSELAIRRTLHAKFVDIRVFVFQSLFLALLTVYVFNVLETAGFALLLLPLVVYLVYVAFSSIKTVGGRAQHSGS